MLPKKIEMHNFGPYIQETVDFERFETSSLFLITGPTGSGKTTLFDAMTYALFGESSGKLRSGKEMRSMFASATEETAVKLLFEHQGRLYSIERKPEQRLAKKRGEGSRIQTAKVFLTVFDEYGKEVFQYSKKTEVDQQIRELLHLDARQFSQIVLLPQGEFRNFLAANSNDKEQLLRNLFGTQFYQKLNDWLKEQLKSKQQANDVLLTRLFQLLSQWPQQLPELSIAEQLDLMKEQEKQELQLHRTAEKQLAAAKKSLAEQAQKLQQAEKTAADFQRLAELQEEQARHETKAARISALKQDYRNFQAAEKLRPLIEQKEAIEKELTENEQTQKTLQEKRETLAQQADEWQTQEALFSAEQAVWADEQQALQRLQELVPDSTRQAALEEQRTAIHAHVCCSQKKAAELERQQAVLQEERALAQQQADGIGALHEQLLLVAQLAQQAQVLLTEQAAVVHDLAQLDQKRHQQEAALSAVQTLQEEGAQLQTELAAAKSRWAQLQIANLSLLLLPGAPCPVCGSVEHPAPASHDTAEKTAIQQAEKRLTELEDEQQRLTAELARHKQQLQTTKIEVKTLTERLTDSRAALKTGQQQLFTAFTAAFAYDGAAELSPLTSALEARQQMLQEQLTAGKKAQQRVQELKNAAAEIQQQLDTTRQQRQQQTTELAGIDSQIALLKERLGAFTAAGLSQQISTKEAALAKHHQLWETHQRKGQALQIERVKQQTTQQELQLRQEKLQQQRVHLQEKLRQNMQKAALNAEQTADYLRQEKAAQDWQKQITAFEQESALLVQKLAELRQLTANQQPPSLSTIKEEYQKTSLIVEEQQRAFYQNAERQKQQQSLLETAVALYSDSQAQLTALSELQQLSQTVNGDNPQKISLERYMLQSCLQEVLLVANQRLKSLTRDRYQFQLQTTAGSYRSQTGLEIDVYDDDAGSTRSAHTLSGGESFIAALTLALALAEVIQMRAGGVAIEALFIDEGFGSLDENSLEMALEALETIETEGRLIGIISHVRELKERIPQQLQIKTKGGGQSEISYRIEEGEQR